ncbi:hypothetical protein B0T16DRAFT_448324 [Cercophora newfieldiana]|uniref:Uncharacterized protein n=1 Tax=Cercophora newfieldiana TaxID=92897 RepID=A0AA40CJG5_9PEZI|nr:hypothetical protein B0T16DRAFT_448324 [Cercophora newfieldiana]
MSTSTHQMMIALICFGALTTLGVSTPSSAVFFFCFFTGICTIVRLDWHDNPAEGRSDETSADTAHPASETSPGRLESAVTPGPESPDTAYDSMHTCPDHGTDTASDELVYDDEDIGNENEDAPAERGSFTFTYKPQPRNAGDVEGRGIHHVFRLDTDSESAEDNEDEAHSTVGSSPRGRAFADDDTESAWHNKGSPSRPSSPDLPRVGIDYAQLRMLSSNDVLPVANEANDANDSVDLAAANASEAMISRAALDTPIRYRLNEDGSLNTMAAPLSPGIDNSTFDESEPTRIKKAVESDMDEDGDIGDQVLTSELETVTFRKKKRGRAYTRGH